MIEIRHFSVVPSFAKYKWTYDRRFRLCGVGTLALLLNELD